MCQMHEKQPLSEVRCVSHSLPLCLCTTLNPPPPPPQGILAVNDLPLVSIDFRCSDVSTTIDSSLTMVMGDDMVKVVAWYDNEWGYR